MSQTNPEDQIDLKNPFLAVILGYMIPGAGHLYQGRYFKSAVFFLCIAGTYCYGMQMAEGKAVYFKKEVNRDAGFQNWGFLAQAGVGTPALAAVIQWKRFTSNANQKERQLKAPMNAPFSGKLILDYPNGQEQMKGLLEGTISLQPVPKERGRVKGTFKGTLDKKENITLQLGGGIRLQKPVSGNPTRAIACEVIEEKKNKEEGEKENEKDEGRLLISGSIPRAFYNSFAAPLEHEDLQDVRRRLGNKYDLAVIFTWIAGLLNILAVWDAYEGPAYGYDDKALQKDKKSKEEEKEKASPPPETPSVPLEPPAVAEQTVQASKK
ncbi:hypothetical protein MNBD_PLANCTO02-182 [hydrothermal vent metagenome]|uniref:DUF6677 domain-containing protein n=1 Tax=hydrothermal vent metagenome TaxID=652676 RepID=A0A3B1DNB8_9ZZZZ